MKIIVDLEKQVVGKNLIEYTEGMINKIATLIEIPCNIEIVNYETRKDNQNDFEAFEALDLIETHIMQQIKTEPQDNTDTSQTPYKC